MELLNLPKNSSDEQLKMLCEFETSNANTRTFKLNRNDRKTIWSNLFNIVQANNSGDDENAISEESQDDKNHVDDSSLKLKALAACRILSRDCTDLNESIEDNHVDLLSQVIDSTSLRWSTEVKFEGKKVLSNCIQQSETVRAYCVQSDILSKVFHLIKSHKVFDEFERFDLRLMFLLTAKCEELRTLANQKLSAIESLTTCLQNIKSLQKDRKTVSSDEAVYMGELLKLLFNVTLAVDQADDKDKLVRLCTALDHAMNMPFHSDADQQNVISNVIGLLTNMLDTKDPTLVIFPHNNTKNVDKLLNFLMKILEGMDKKDESFLQLKQEISPVLMVLWGVSKLHPHVRKYLKSVILPPLTAEDLKRKPEEGTSLKARLVKLFTNPDTQISMMAAEFIFVLCKHNVGKMVKQTGYGHAAGLLARRGLMMGGRGEDVFSSDSEGDQEEEEGYKKEAHKVNPITNVVEEERPSPFEGMSDEQKEYEAMKMVNMINDLMKTGIIKPATVGPDGKPVEVEHVLQLQEGLKIPASSDDPNQSDSD